MSLIFRTSVSLTLPPNCTFTHTLTVPCSVCSPSPLIGLEIVSSLIPSIPTFATAHILIPSFADTKKSARELARDDLIKVLTHRSGDAVNWLTDRFGLDLSKVSRLGGHSEKRTHRGGAQFPGMTITYALMEKLEDLTESHPDRVKILKKAKVTKVLKEGEKVVGVQYEKDGKSVCTVLCVGRLLIWLWMCYDVKG